MHTYNDAFFELRQALQQLYDEREAAAIAHEVMEYITGKTKLHRITEKETVLTEAQQSQFDDIKVKLITGMPLQYATCVAWFMEKPYSVNENVLIPRPETEEIVEWIATDQKAKEDINIIDIGTGSGCIPISLKHLLPEAYITAIDISEGALEVAKRNARELKADIHFKQTDFLNEAEQDALGVFDVIVSNPPYIPQTELEQLHQNVRDFEPHLALFTPSNDPQLFYRAIAAFGKTHLKANGGIYCELHVDYGAESKKIFEEAGYREVETRKDMHGNLRMLKAVL